MAVPQNFRKAFNGFHKDDVVQYLEYINTKHNNQVNQLTTELEELRSQLEASDQQERIAALQAQCDALTQKLQTAEEELEQLRSSQSEVIPIVQCAPSELEIYRRAEKTEQEAKERAELIYYQANSVLTEATSRVDTVSREVMETADQIMAQLTKLQMMVSSGKQVLLEAASLMNIIRPNK